MKIYHVKEKPLKGCDPTKFSISLALQTQFHIEQLIFYEMQTIN